MSWFNMLQGRTHELLGDSITVNIDLQGILPPAKKYRFQLTLAPEHATLKKLLMELCNQIKEVDLKKMFFEESGKIFAVDFVFIVDGKCFFSKQLNQTDIPLIDGSNVVLIPPMEGG